MYLYYHFDIVQCIFFSIYIYIYHHHHVVPLARISLTLSRHFSLSFITSGRSSGLHPVSSHSCCMYVRAGRSAFARPYVGVHWSTSLMSSSLLLQQCPACLIYIYIYIYIYILSEYFCRFLIVFLPFPVCSTSSTVSVFFYLPHLV